MFVLFLISIVALLSVAATSLLRPAARRLDLHQDFAHAQAVADGALAKALANLEGNRPLEFSKAIGNLEGWEDAVVNTLPDSGGKARREIRIEGRARDTALKDAGEFERKWAVVRVLAVVERDATRGWKVAEYEVIESVREDVP